MADGREAERAALVARLELGREDSRAWLTVTEAAVLFTVDRSSVNKWLKNPKGVRVGDKQIVIHFRPIIGGKVLDPDDLLQIWRETTRLRSAADDATG